VEDEVGAITGAFVVLLVPPTGEVAGATAAAGEETGESPACAAKGSDATTARTTSHT
jgi:hypothetical protein